MLSEIPLFADLTREEVDIVSSRAVTREFPKNAFVITDGDSSDSLYVIERGKTKVFLIDENGKEIILNMLGPGEYFGELALLDDAPRSASVMTLTPCRFTIISKSQFQQCIVENPRIAITLLQHLAKRIRALTENVRDLALHDVYQRVTNTLEKLAIEQNGEHIIPQRVTHQELANMVGASREMVSRIMKDLSRGGYVRIESQQIRIEKKFPAAW
jgi:CRP/FNR family cyclic AMP-dependent transcriptional regulator